MFLGLADDMLSMVFGGYASRLVGETHDLLSKKPKPFEPVPPKPFTPSPEYTRGNARLAPPAIEFPSGVAEERRDLVRAQERAKSRSMGVEKVRDRSPAAPKAGSQSLLAKLTAPLRPGGPKPSLRLLGEDDEEGYYFGPSIYYAGHAGSSMAGQGGKKPEPS